jgi:hypothetical protein
MPDTYTTWKDLYYCEQPVSVLQEFIRRSVLASGHNWNIVHMWLNQQVGEAYKNEQHVRTWLKVTGYHEYAPGMVRQMDRLIEEAWQPNGITYHGQVLSPQEYLTLHTYADIRPHLQPHYARMVLRYHRPRTHLAFLQAYLRYGGIVVSVNSLEILRQIG